MDDIAQAFGEGVLTLTLNRPQKKNALTNAMYGQLADAMERAEADAQVRCLVLTGAGDVFTSGNDLADFAAIATGALSRQDMHVHRFLDTLACLKKPIVAAVPGLAVGVGATLLLHCDLVYLAQTASLSAPFVDLALTPEAASSLLFPARIGHVRSFALFALGEKLDAAAALSLGLANQVVADQELQSVARGAAIRLASKPPGALAATKRLMRDSQQLIQRMLIEANQFQACLLSPEAREAFSAFAQRRAPDFRGLSSA